ncbi:class I adenylate-forming enzyme family protein [Actinokineospora sp.]|uniref:class I adenylate-forming enzyme family protein n=1 Tax=Actinokineospora sp. TaxID=1872133 RepID=UPI0040380B99
MAMICGTDCVRTLVELERDAVRMADVLRGRGIRVGDRVLLKAGNSVGYVAALLALMHAGASITLLDHQERPEATAQVIKQAGIVLCVVDGEALMPETSVACVSVYELQLAAVRSTATEPLAADTWRALPDGLLMFSSGSTGSPKVIVKTGESFLRNLKRNIDLVGHVETDVLVPLLPFSHQYGLSMVLIAWLSRCSLVVAAYRRLDHALVMADLCGATVFDATPATYRSMMNIVGRRPALGSALTSARMLCVGAAPLDAGLVTRCEQEFGHTLLDSYGSTEMGNVSFATLDNPAACGQAVAGVDLSVVDDDGTALPAGTVGEIMVRTPDVMSGYLDEFGFLMPVVGEWFPSGDFGFLDDYDNLHVLGRKRAVDRLGYTLYPDIIERKIAKVVGSSAKIVALPDERTGTQLVVFIEDNGGRSATFWRERIAAALPAYEVPNRVVVIDNFPLNNNGKPDSKRLEELAVSA